MTQLTLELWPYSARPERGRSRPAALRLVAWVGVNATARGRYYHFYWQGRDSGGRVKTYNRYIRGSRVGSELGESRRGMVEGWIAEGMALADILRGLEALPLSSRRSRSVSFGESCYD